MPAGLTRLWVGGWIASGVTHKKIRPHTPTDNVEIERYHRTIGDRLDEEALEAFTQAESVIDGIIDWYNHHRLHSALSFLRPVRRRPTIGVIRRPCWPSVAGS